MGLIRAAICLIGHRANKPNSLAGFNFPHLLQDFSGIPERHAGADLTGPTAASTINPSSPVS
jgi:hypothetical protein